MNQRIRAIERQLACHRAYVIAEPIAETFVETWEQAMDEDTPRPDVLDLVQAIVAEGVAILAIVPITSYLNQCARDDRIPDPDRLAEAIVHGYSETRLHHNRQCRCLPHV